MTTESGLRHIKGVNLVDLVKLLKSQRKRTPFSVSPETEQLLSEHILPSDWYPFEPFMELIDATWEHLLGKSAAAARQLGIAGGAAALTSYHKTFVKPGDPMASVLGMRHSWGAYFDFGRLTAEPVGDRAVAFTLTGYPDASVAHGEMIVGWHVSAGIVAGVRGTISRIIECPWRDGSDRLVHHVHF